MRLIYRSEWREQLKGLPPDKIVELLDMAIDYAEHEKEPDGDPMTKALFNMMRPTIDHDREEFNHRCEVNRRNGAKGGRPRKTQENPQEPAGFSEDQNQNPKNPSVINGTENNPSVFFGQNQNPKNPSYKLEDISNKNEVLNNKNEGYKESIGAEAPRTLSIHRFSKPSPQEVDEYSQEQGYWIDGQYFCDYYESNGWKVGRNPMKNWKATVRNWIKKERENPTNNNINNLNNHNNGNYQRTKGPNPAELFRAIEHGLSGGDVPF